MILWVPIWAGLSWLALLLVSAELIHEYEVIGRSSVSWLIEDDLC